MKKLPPEHIDAMVDLLGSVDEVIEKYRAKYPDAPFEVPGFAERLMMAQTLAQQQLGMMLEGLKEEAQRDRATHPPGVGVTTELVTGKLVPLTPGRPPQPGIMQAAPAPIMPRGAPAIGIGADGQTRLIDPDPAFLKQAHGDWEALLKKDGFPLNVWARLKTLLRETEQGRRVLTTLSYENYKLRNVQPTSPVVSEPKPQSPPPPQGPPPAPPKKGGKK